MLHNPLILLVVAMVLLGVLVLIVKALKVGASKDAKTDVYYLKKSLFTPAERSFLGVLESLGIGECRIAAKVRLADIFGVRKGQGWRAAFNRINAKHVDFLLIRQSDGAPILGIELDDSSHDEPDRVERDKFVDAVFASVKLSIIHVPARQSYEVRAIKEEILSALTEAKR